MRIVAWPCPAPGGTGEEFAIVAGPSDARARVLFVPALFEEANRTRRMLVETMRALAHAETASVLADLPGCAESLAPLASQDLRTWCAAVAAAASHFAATHALCLRGGALLAPERLPGWRIEPIGGSQVLRPMLRSRTVAAREDGRGKTIDGLLATGRETGVELAGYHLGAAMVRELEAASVPEASQLHTLGLADLGGAALWLRSEPGEDAQLSAALAGRIARDIAR